MPGHLLEKQIPFGSNFKALHNNCKVIADIGSGGDPYEHATILVDKYMKDNYQRGVSLKVPEGKTFINADIIELPFANKKIDFAFCKFIFEHVHEPDKACKELTRVAKKGLIVSPTLLWETLFARPKDKHRWVLSVEKDVLIFTVNRCDEFLTAYFDNLFASKKQEGLDFKYVFWQNYDKFINCFYWEDDFKFEVRQ